MGNWICKNCGYSGKDLIFQFTDYSYCMATNEIEPEYKAKPPKWVEDKSFGESKIGEPVGCLKCHAWGVNYFE